VFQWIVPEDRQRYGIQVQDRTGSVPGDDIINLSVRGTGAGQARLDLRRSVYEETNGFTLGTADLEMHDLTPPSDAAFIALALIHPTADTDQLYAGWMFLDADFEAASSWTLFDNPADIFHGETTGYRPAFFGSQPVPEAESWALMLAGLGLLGWRVRRSRA
jgi:MYXO-CTERM domain-containing protein